MNLFRFGLLGLSSAVISVLMGCAHPINLEPIKLPDREESKGGFKSQVQRS